MCCFFLFIILLLLFFFIRCKFDARSIVYHLSVCMQSSSLPVMFCYLTHSVYFPIRLLPYICVVYTLVGLRLRAFLCIVVVHWSALSAFEWFTLSFVCYLISCAGATYIVVVASPDFIVRCVFVSFALLNQLYLDFFSFCLICTHW